MYGQITTTKLIKRGARAYGLMAAALAALFFLSGTPAQAQLGDGSVRHVRDGLSVGLTPGQTLRVTVFNPRVHPARGDGSSERGDMQRDAQRSTVRSLVVVFNGQNTPIAQTGEVEIPAGEFHSFDISRDDIPLTGEPRTGRVQIRFEMVFTGGVSVAAGNVWEPDGGRFPSTFELMDDQSGKTVLIGLLLPAVQHAPVTK